MGHYAVGALVVVILMTMFIEFYLFRFELFSSSALIKKRRWFSFKYNAKGWDVFMLFFAPTLKMPLFASQLLHP